MKLAEYLPEVRHAVQTVIAEIYREQHVVSELRAELYKLEAATADGYQRVEFLAMNPDLDDEGLGTAIHWDTYFGPDKERYYKRDDLGKIIGQVAAHEFSVSALCGSLLQYGKQGLSLQFGKHKHGCPDGRLISGVPLREVIWQGRHQALHWEDGSFNKAVTNCFHQLAASLDPVFTQYKHRSMAFEVVSHLDWRSADNFMRDMRLFDV